jgi:hypothetical protein
MADQPENLPHEMLRRVHSQLEDMQTEMRHRFAGAETGLAAIEQHLAAFYLSDAARVDEITDLRRRIERIERRLDLADG